MAPVAVGLCGAVQSLLRQSGRLTSLSRGSIRFLLVCLVDSLSPAARVDSEEFLANMVLVGADRVGICRNLRHSGWSLLYPGHAVWALLTTAAANALFMGSDVFCGFSTLDQGSDRGHSPEPHLPSRCAGACARQKNDSSTEVRIRSQRQLRSGSLKSRHQVIMSSWRDPNRNLYRRAGGVAPGLS